ncbi:LOW QUALITY PROTEIN: protein FAM186A [Erethizon dorsatum]
MLAKKQSETGSDSESEREVENSNITRRWSRTALDLPVAPTLEIPFSVQAVISRIEQAQLLRARQDINMQLSGIMNNVNRIITRYTAIDFNTFPGRKFSYAESKKTQRNLFLEKMDAYAKAADLREKSLVYILAWLEEWNAILSEITVIDVDEHHHWIAQMEMLPETLKTIINNVEIMCKISRYFLEDKKKQKKKLLSRGTLWKSWKERAIKRPATAHALRPDQMINDQLATNTKVSEIKDMLQELIGTAMFNKLETTAIKYISSTIINFSEALNMLNDELKLMNFPNAINYVDEVREEEKDVSLKIIQDLSEQNEMLTQKLKDAEEKCEQLIRSKVVSGPRPYILSPTFSTLKVPPGLSPQSSMAIEDTMDSILTKEFENIIDESQRKGTKGTGIKWDSAVSHTPQVEMTPDLTKQQYILPEKKWKILSRNISGDSISLKKDDNDKKDGTGSYSSQNRKLIKDPHPQKTSESNLSTGKDEQKALEAKPGQYSKQQSLEKKRKRRKLPSEGKSSTESKSQHISSTETDNEDQKSGKSMRDQLRKLQPEYSLEKGPIPSETEAELTTKSMDKDIESELTEPFKMIKADFTSEPQKVEMKGKKPLGTTTSNEEKTDEKEMHDFTKQAPSQSKITKKTLPSPDGKSEQSNLELLQKAILTFLKEKIESTGKHFDKKRVLKEEELLIKAEVEKLAVIKATMEEYFQKVAETVTKTLRKYKDIKMKKQVGEKSIKQKQGVSFMPGLHFQESLINAKSETSSFLSSESTDPVTDAIIQTILAEMESEIDVPKVSIAGNSHEKKGKRQQEKYLQEGQEQMSGVDLKHHQLEVKNLWKENYKMISENLEEKKALLKMKEVKQGQQEQKQWQEEEMWKEQQKQRIQKQTQQDEKQKQWESEKEEQQKPKQQQLEARKQKMKEQGVPFEEKDKEKIQQIQKEMRHQDLKMSRGKDEEKQELSREIEDLKRQRLNTAKYQMMKESGELAKMVTQSQVTLSPRGKTTLEYKTESYHGEKMQRNLKILESLPEENHPKPVTPPISTQSSPTGTNLVSGQPLTEYITLGPEQALALGITPTPQEVQKTEFTSAPVISQTLGKTLTSEQAQTLRAPLTLEHISKMQTPSITEQAQEVSTIRTQERAQASRVPITLEQAQRLKESSISEKTQAIQTPSTTKQSQIFGVPIAEGKTEALRITHTPHQAKDLAITLTPQQVQAQGIALSPQQAQAQGIALYPQQAQVQGITLTPQQAQAQGIALTPQQAKDLGITLSPQQAQAQGITLNPQQAKDLEITLTPQQAQAQGITLTPQQARAQGIALSPQQARAQGISLSPQQARAQGIALAPQQARAQGIALSPQQVRAQGITLTPQQAKDLGITLTPQQVQAQGITLTPQQAKDLGITLMPLQKLRPLLSQAPFTPEKHLGMNIPSAPGELLGPQILPTSRQMLALRGQASPTEESLPQEVFPAPGHHPISGACPTTEQPLQPEALSSGHFFILRGLPTPWPPLASQATPTLRQPLISRVSPTFGQIPRLWAPLSPGQSLVPGVSSIRREKLRESEPLAFSERPPGFQPPATPEQPLQTPSTFGQPLAPWTLPGKVSPLWLLPTPKHPSTLWASPPPGKPQRVLSSSVTQKRLAIVSSLKSKSAVVQARAIDFKVSQAPFTSKKFQISEPPDTYEETQILQNTCVTEPFETLQLSLTSYRTPVSQTPHTDEAVLPTFMKPVTSLPSLITQLSKRPQSSPSEGGQKSRFPSTDQPWILTSVSGTKKHKMMVPPSSPKEIIEKRYFVDVEAQRKNLILLNQATKASGLPLQQHTTARNLIIAILHMDTVRLGYLVRKYIAYRLIQRARNNIIKQLKAIQNTGKGYETQNLYIMLSRIDDYQKRVMGVWTEKQKSLEQKRNQGLKKMMHLFSQFQEMYKLNLSQPIPLIVAKKQIPASTKFVPKPFLELLIEENKKSDIFKKFRPKEAVREAIWNADLSTSSYPITKKTSIMSLWAQLGGYPDIPRLLQLDIQSTFRKALVSIPSQ